MSDEPRISIDRDRIAEFCRKHGIVEFSLFGSVLRDDFGPSSDVDVLVKFDPSRKFGLFAFAGMELELAEMFGREVDLVDKVAVEQSKNPYRRRSILSSYSVLYAN